MGVSRRRPTAMVVASTTKVVVKEAYTADLSQAVWQRSSRDDGQGGAVEVAFVGELVALRAQPEPGQPEGDVLIFTLGEWDAFVGGAKDGEFDLD